MAGKTAEQKRYEHLETQIDISNQRMTSLVINPDMVEEMLVLKQGLGRGFYLLEDEGTSPKGGQRLKIAC